ncbi:MAG TPA: DUF3857 domain-containing protein, partial [Terriglobales bacterium]|nr:DUF3857 domain-containing protein [Terriglobales bacterium]
MATLRKFRLAWLCALTFLVGTASATEFAVCDGQSHSWFDQQAHIKKQQLLTLTQRHDQRSALVAVSLLDDLWILREQVSCPADISRTFQQMASDPEAQTAATEEAKSLAERSSRYDPSPAAEERAKALVKWANGVGENDVELLEALVAINLLHGWPYEAEAEHAAELSRSAEAWHRAALATNDDDRRFQAERRALALDSHYVPALLALAHQYSGQGQLTRARLLLTEALEQGLNEPAVSALLAEMDITEGHGSAALARMNALRSRPLSTALARALARDYAQLGLIHEARQLARFAQQISPSGSVEHDLLAQLGTEALNSSLNVEGESIDGEAEAEPTVVDADAERLRHLLRGENAPATDSSRAYLADAQELIRKWRALPVTRRGESRVLADIRVDELHADYQTVQHIQSIIALGSGADVGTYRNRGIQYSPQTQQLTVIHARVHHPNGRITDAEDQGESPVADASVAAYYDLRAQQFRFRDLSPGDVIEVEYKIAALSSANPYGQYFASLVAFGGALPYDLQRYVLRATTGVHVSSAQHLLTRPQVRRARNETIYVWEKRDNAALIREPRSPSWSEQGAYVHVSNFETWEALGKWYADLLRPQFKLTPELEFLAAQATSQHPDRLDRVEAIDDLVLRSTRYVALEFGVYGFKPYPVAQTFARKFGDCKDKASLMVALLRASGIDAQIALVRTQHLGEILTQPASVSVFDHAIVYVPEFDLWLDGTAEFARLRELPVEDQGVMALTVDPNGDAVLRRTPKSTADDNYSRRTINARLDADGTIHFSGATYVRGEDAPELRRQLEVRDAKLLYVRDRLAQVLPAVEIHDVESPVGAPEVVSLSFSGDLATYRGSHTASLPSSWMERNYLSTLAPGTTRTQDLILEAPWTTEEEIHIQLPPGAKVTSLPDAQTIGTSFGRASLDYEVNGNEITVF